MLIGMSFRAFTPERVKDFYRGLKVCKVRSNVIGGFPSP